MEEKQCKLCEKEIGELERYQTIVREDDVGDIHICWHCVELTAITYNDFQSLELEG